MAGGLNRPGLVWACTGDMPAAPSAAPPVRPIPRRERNERRASDEECRYLNIGGIIEVYSAPATFSLILASFELAAM